MNIGKAQTIVEAWKNGDVKVEELYELRDALPAIFADAIAWRKGHAILEELRERIMPCGHAFENLIGGDGVVTKCGQCLENLRQSRQFESAKVTALYGKRHNTNLREFFSLYSLGRNQYDEEWVQTWNGIGDLLAKKAVVEFRPKWSNEWEPVNKRRNDNVATAILFAYERIQLYGGNLCYRVSLIDGDKDIIREWSPSVEK